MVDKNKVVSVAYRLTVNEDGQETLIEETEAGKPFVFLFGSGGLIEAFENNLKGLKTGDSFDFKIDVKNAYGESHADNVVNIPIEAFLGEDGKLDEEMVQVGNVLPMVDNEGHRMQGTVEEITDAHVKMDFNHPLADKDLHFKGKVVDVREATPEEISHGHVHGEGEHHH